MWFLFPKAPLFKAGHLYQRNTMSCHLMHAVGLQFKLLRHKVIILRVSKKVSYVKKKSSRVWTLHTDLRSKGSNTIIISLWQELNSVKYTLRDISTDFLCPSTHIYTADLSDLAHSALRHE